MKNMVASLTTRGKCANVLMQTAVIAMLLNATVPISVDTSAASCWIRVLWCSRTSAEAPSSWKESASPMVGRLQAKRRWFCLCEIQAGGHAGSMGSTSRLLWRRSCLVLCKTCVECCGYVEQRQKNRLCGLLVFTMCRWRSITLCLTQIFRWILRLVRKTSMESCGS